MPHREKAFSTARRMAAALLLAGAGGCSTLTPPPPAAPAPTPLAERMEYRHEVRFETDQAQPGAEEALRLDRFLAQLPPEGRTAFNLTARADERAGEVYNLALSARRAAAVEARIRHRIGADADITTAALGERSPMAAGSGERAWAENRTVAITARVYLLRLPECPDWSRDPGMDPRNLPLAGLGCANATNLGLMVADPGDLERGRRLGAADGTREAEAVARYRADKIKALDESGVSQ